MTTHSEDKTTALEDPACLRGLKERLGRLEDFATQVQAENTIRAYTTDLEDSRDWYRKKGRERLPAGP